MDDVDAVTDPKENFKPEKDVEVVVDEEMLVFWRFESLEDPLCMSDSATDLLIDRVGQVLRVIRKCY